MPLFEYRCHDCGVTFEELRSLAQADLGVECPECGGGEVERQLSSFATSAGSAGSSASGGGRSSASSCGGGGRGFS